jgi:hypothetical protein
MPPLQANFEFLLVILCVSVIFILVCFIKFTFGYISMISVAFFEKSINL